MNPMNKDKKAIKTLAQNRKAYHDYFVLDKYEAGIELFGTEVKSLRLGQANLKDSYCTTDGRQIWVNGLHSWAATASWVMPVWWRKAAMASASSR